MRFIFKTDYAQDIRLAKHGGHLFWYSALLLLLVAAPWLFAEYWLAQLTLVLIYSIAGLGLMLLAGSAMNRRQRQPGARKQRHGKDEPLDTVQDWPPQAVRVLPLPE